MDAWLAHWGYLAVAVGACFEGEAVLLAAGALAHQRTLALPWVALCGCLGSIAWSQAWFQTARHLGPRLIARRPRLQARAEQVRVRIARYAGWYVLVFRFIAGMGTASPAVLGASGYPPRSFLAFDALGAALWSAAVSGMGWGLGLGVDRLLAVATHDG
jgi:membrane protein DedA with SNARE-associated domain